MTVNARKDIVVGKHVKISRENPDNLRPISVNDLLITHTRNEFFLTFSIVEPPPFLEEKEFEDLHEIKAIARVKLVLSPEFTEATIKALSSNLESFKSEGEQDVAVK